VETRELGKFICLASASCHPVPRPITLGNARFEVVMRSMLWEMSMSTLLGNVVVLIDCCAFSLIVLDC
jgi:hypothetical protein